MWWVKGVGEAPDRKGRSPKAQNHGEGQGVVKGMGRAVSETRDETGCIRHVSPQRQDRTMHEDVVGVLQNGTTKSAHRRPILKPRARGKYVTSSTRLTKPPRFSPLATIPVNHRPGPSSSLRRCMIDLFPFAAKYLVRPQFLQPETHGPRKIELTTTFLTMRCEPCA